ncbi:hypothetical protein [Kitasatospora terrestris]|uniref:Uncharacterized protein n=1 Tax=Kitasatospora terrestris TaxID=258051 RepID=A0ABP9DJ17_9ACTN
MTLTAGHTTSGGEQVAAALPGATAVKVFGTVMAGGTETGAFGGQRLLLPTAGRR